MDRRAFVIRGDAQRELACAAVWQAPLGWAVDVREATRTLDQNAKLWPMLTDLSRQVEWQCNGQAVMLSPDDWKDIATASLVSEQRIAAGMDGGFVMLGRKTSTLGKRAFSDLIEIIYAFGARHGVEWSEPMERQT